MRIVKCLLAVLLAAVFLAVLMALPGMAQTRSRGQGRAKAITGDVPGVTLSAEQRQRVMQIRRETQSRIQTIQRDRDLTSAEKSRRIRQLQKESHDSIMSVLTPEQRRQFVARYGRPPAVASTPSRGASRGGAGQGRGEVTPPRGLGRGQLGIPNINLTAQQRDQIAEIRSDTQRRIQEVRRNPNLSVEEKADRIDEIRDDGRERVLRVLTPQQRVDLEEWWEQHPEQAQGSGGGVGTDSNRD